MPDADWLGLCRAEDEVHPAVRADNVANLADLEGVRGILEWLLHLALHIAVRDTGSTGLEET